MMSSENDIFRARIHALEAENGKLRLDVDTLTVLVGTLTGRVDVLCAPHAVTPSPATTTRDHYHILRQTALGRIIPREAWTRAFDTDYVSPEPPGLEVFDEVFDAEAAISAFMARRDHSRRCDSQDVMEVSDEF